MTEVLILAPHPDDETISCAGILQDAVKTQKDIVVVFITNGEGHMMAAENLFGVTK